MSSTFTGDRGGSHQATKPPVPGGSSPASSYLVLDPGRSNQHLVGGLRVQQVQPSLVLTTGFQDEAAGRASAPNGVGTKPREYGGDWVGLADQQLGSCTRLHDSQWAGWGASGQPPGRGA